jgi:hypothetical protein
MFFFETPTAHKIFRAELTLVGRIKNGWEIIQSLTWGFTYNNGRLNPSGINKMDSPSEYHIQQLNLAIRIHL